MNPVVNTFIKVKLNEEQNFLKVKETLTRMGIPSKKENRLFQSCHILHKRGEFYIVHFKELFLLDNKPTLIVEDDLQRRNLIASLLEEWNLITIMNPEICEVKAPISSIKVIAFKEKDDWILESKYTIGRKKF